MAVMYPPDIYSGTKSPGEIAVFQKLKEDLKAKDWYVLHSLNIADHTRKISGEADFVIIVPKKGIVCLEVKASTSIKVSDGVWYYGSDTVGEKRSPFAQVVDASHSIVNKIKDIPGVKLDFPIWGFVLFPFCQFSKDSIEWHPWEYADMNDFKSRDISDIVLNFLDSAKDYLKSKPNQLWFNPSSINPSSSSARMIAEKLRPNFEFHSPLKKSDVAEEERKYFTKEQFAALDQMQSNKRVIFEGPAGTGKTLLALEAARRSTSLGKSVLFLCFNRLLGDWLVDQTRNLPNKNVGSLHSLLLQFTGIDPSDYDTKDRDFWPKTLPRAAVDFLLDKELNFDEVIVDEAQDIIWNKDYLDFLDVCIKDGLSSGRWRFFGDFEKQGLFPVPENFSLDNLDERISSAPKYSLRINCRNTPRIAEYVKLLGGLSEGYASVRRPDNGINPEIVFYEYIPPQEEILIEVIEKCLHEGWTPSDIVVLSLSPSPSPYFEDTKAFPCKVSDFSLNLDKQSVGFTSVLKYKGLESPVIIIKDVWGLRNSKTINVFYTAISRALDKLIILVFKKEKDTIMELISKR